MERVFIYFLNNKIEKLEGGDYLLFTYCHAAAIILHQLLSFVDFKKTHINF
jgi:hypothetical protein